MRVITENISSFGRFFRLFEVWFMSAKCADRFSEKIRQRRPISAQFTPSGNSGKTKLRMLHMKL